MDGGRGGEAGSGGEQTLILSLLLGFFRGFFLLLCDKSYTENKHRFDSNI